MHNIYHDLVIDSPRTKVFGAVSRPEELIKWWPLKCSGEPAVGKTYNFYFGPEYDWLGTVTDCEPDAAFHIKMTRSDPDWEHTSFGFDLEETKNGTSVSFWHKGWPDCNKHFRIASFCWAILLKGLKDYCEQGTIIPFEQRS
jgi:uncharacterized protein YndB with AHSA1/START domain